MKPIFITLSVIVATLLVVVAVNRIYDGSIKREVITLDEYLLSMPKHYDANGFQLIKSEREINDDFASFYVIKCNAALNDGDKKNALKHIESILYFYSKGGNERQLNAWVNLKQKIASK